MRVFDAGGEKWRRQRVGHGDRRGLLVVLGWAVLATSPLLGGGGPENVAVVVNADSWASKAVANEYVQLRRIPASNVIYVRGLKDVQNTDVETFREQVLVPVFKILWERDVLEQIDYITYSSDFPTAVHVQRDFGEAKPPKQLAPTASITGLTYLYQLVIAKRPEYLSLSNNFYMRRPVSSVNRMPKSEADRRAYQQGGQLVAGGQWEAALRILEPLAERMPDDANLQYNLACCLARLERVDDAMQTLEKAAAAGWSDRQHAEADEDLKLLRALAAFPTVLAKMDAKKRELMAKQERMEVQPTLGFRSQYVWNERGEKVDAQGVRYVLSTMLGVTSGRGNSVREAVESLRRSAGADATNPAGTIYFMENKDIRATTRKPAFVAAVHALDGTGVKGEIVNGTLPKGKKDVLGAMVGAAGFNWGSSGSTILPGAICEHLTSFGGMMGETAGQTPLTEFIRHGAAGSSGTVTEPFAIQEKFPFAFLHVHYVRGCSLAEAFYQSVFGPFQLLIVGDPLCQPWAKRLQLEMDGVAGGQSVSGRLAISPRVVGVTDVASIVDHFELFVDGKRKTSQKAGRQFTLDTTELADGWHELRLVAVAAGAIETQSALVLSIVIDNDGNQVTLEQDANESKEVLYGSNLVVRATASGTATIAVTHNARILGTISGRQGTVSIDTRELGLGPVVLLATAKLDGQNCASQPLALRVVPPPPLPPVQPGTVTQLADGFELTLGNAPPTVVTETKDAKWLAKLEPPAGERIAIDALFEVPADDVYQFQLSGNSLTAIAVDGQTLWPAGTGPAGATSWTAVPVHLAKGLHRFHLDGTVAKSPALQVRFGGPGCTSLDGNRFRHSP